LYFSGSRIPIIPQLSYFPTLAQSVREVKKCKEIKISSNKGGDMVAT
jgi:hypothetical protein